LVHRIIDLHQGKTGDRNYHNLNELTSDLAELSRKFLPRRMQLNVELAAESLPVYLDAVEFRQVLIGLILNAVEATPPQGRLILRTTVHAHLPPLPRVHGTLPRTPAACLSVEDQGCGIQSRHLGSLFDPFFTTKPASKSAGLGLYNAGHFAEKHGGAISVQSTEGAGTTVQIWLPQADFTEAENYPTSSASAASPFAAEGAPTPRAP
jgi:signal transduction histidine kinase